MNWRRYLWPAIGIAAVVFSLWLLLHELRGISLNDVWASIIAIPTRGWVLAALIRSPPMHRLPATTTLRCSISADEYLGYSSPSVPSPPMRCRTISAAGVLQRLIRYRVWHKRPDGQDVGVLVAICWITFVLSTPSSRIVLVFERDHRLPALPITC
jgi:hypothetical protein